MKTPQPIEIDEAQVGRLIEQARKGQLEAAAQKWIVPLRRTLVGRQRTLLETRISLAKLTHDELEQLRCGACGALFVTHMPPQAGQETYDLSLKVNLAVPHYHLGLPFKRIESSPHLVGMPLPDATQWELVEQVADSAYPVYESLKRLGAQQAV